MRTEPRSQLTTKGQESLGPCGPTEVQGTNGGVDGVMEAGSTALSILCLLV